MSFVPSRLPVPAATRVPKRISWASLHSLLKDDLDFRDVIVDGETRITANLYATDPFLPISRKCSILIHLSFTRDTPSKIRSTGYIVIPPGRRGETIDFKSAREAIVSAIAFQKKAQEGEMYRMKRKRGDVETMDWEDRD